MKDDKTKSKGEQVNRKHIKSEDIQKTYSEINASQVFEKVERYLGAAGEKAYYKRLRNQGKVFEYNGKYFTIHSDHEVIVLMTYTERPSPSILSKDFPQELMQEALLDAQRLNYDLFLNVYVCIEACFLRYRYSQKISEKIPHVKKEKVNYWQANLTSRTINFIERSLRSNFDINGVLKYPFEFQKEILDEIIFLESFITGIKYSIKQSSEFKHQLAEIKGKNVPVESLKEIFQVYNRNLEKLKRKKYELGRQIFFIRRLADVIPFSIFPREIIREWLKLQEVGFISSKKGLIGELKAFEKLRLEGKKAILCDLTNCMRFYDIYVIDEGSFYECKTRFTQEKQIEIETSSLGRKFKSVMQNCTKYLESDVQLSSYQHEIVNLIERECELPISAKIFDDAYEVFIIHNSAIKNKYPHEAIEFLKRTSGGGYVCNPGLVNQILMPAVKPIFSFGFKPETLTKLFQRQINLMISINLRKLNDRLERQHKIWRVDEGASGKIFTSDYSQSLATVIFPWTLLLNECITIDSFIEWIDFLIKFLSIS